MADSTRVVATRDLKLYYVPWHASTILPANTVLWGTAWGTPAGQAGAYVDAGYTIGGLSFAMSVDRTPINVDQELDPILRIATGRDATMTTALAEFTPQNVRIATGQGTVTTVAAGAARGYDDLDITSTVTDTYYTIGFDALSVGDGEAIRIVGWKVLPTGSPNLSILPTEATTIPIEGALIPDTSVSPARIAKVRDIIAIAA